ncbi:MAG: hypothetical protein B7X58_02865 [Marinobacter sp. 34-60-7]|nr:MAG: hypothetical protein B7X58_02865 [Marinobacter sp. 34-60-7]
MGLLVDGKWVDQWYDTSKTGGKFEREAARFRNWVTADGAPGPDGKGGFAAESGRYHLYVSLACPWAHRTLIFRKLKGLEPHISVSIVHPDMVENGWEFRPGDEMHQDHLYNSDFMHQIYTRAAPDYSGRVTVPVLWDKQQQTIVSNESADIIRMFNTAFSQLDGVDAELDLYPEPLRADIDAINERVYDTVNNGVYRAGFATIDLSALLRNLAETYEIVAEEGGQSLTHDIAPGSFIEGDRDLLNQLFANLIENAIRHAGPTAHIDLHAQGRIVHITDDGPGIPSAEHARIFQRFVRLDQSRHSPGSGLGLAIVAAIAELHDAEVRIENRHPGVMIEIDFG